MRLDEVSDGFDELEALTATLYCDRVALLTTQFPLLGVTAGETRQSMRRKNVRTDGSPVYRNPKVKEEVTMR